MKKILILLFVSLCFVVIAVPCIAARVSLSEAETAAQNWIDIIIEKKHSWGGATAAHLESMVELKRKGRTIGYFATVSPRGFIIISLRKELAPIKAYSARNNLDPDADVGLADLVKGNMEGIISGIEKHLGALDKIPTRALQNILEIDYSRAWDNILKRQKRPVVIRTSDAGEADGGDDGEPLASYPYQEGEYLLSSVWNQQYPYTAMTPDLGCTNNGGHAVVGCVATAGAQIMRYWNWPPYGKTPPIYPAPGLYYPEVTDPYDWPSMLDWVKNSSPQASIDAVAELCAEVGHTVHMTYGCSGSSADTSSLAVSLDLYFRYTGSMNVVYRAEDHGDGDIQYTATEWFDLMKAQFNLNRPIAYKIEGHSIVADGWQFLTDPFLIRQYHMNYGHNATDTAWYTLDALHQSGGGGISDEYMIINIFPASSLRGTIESKVYEKIDFPYFYFDRDTVGGDASFEPGLNLQFLQGVKVTNTMGTEDYIRFIGNLLDTTRLFARGDPSRGARIDNGTIKLYKNGSLKMF